MAKDSEIIRQVGKFTLSQFGDIREAKNEIFLDRPGSRSGQKLGADGRFAVV
jgi:hypothetical protein